MRTLIAAALLVVACADERVSPPPAQAEASAPRLVAGLTMVYGFEWQVDALAADTRVLPEGTPVQARVDMRGELAVRVVEADASRTVLAVALRRLDRHGLSLFGHEVIADPSVLVGREAFVVVPPGGDAHEVLFAADTPPVLRQVLSGVLAHLDLRVAPDNARAWKAQVPGANGLANVSYEIEGELQRRTLQGYARLDAVPPTGHAPIVYGEAVIVPGPDGMPLQIDADEQLRVLAADGETTAFDSTTRFALRRIGEEQGAGGGMPEPAQLRTHDLAAPPADAEVQQELARKFAEGLTVDDVQLVVDGLAHGLLPRGGFVVEATGMLRGWPDRAQEMAPMFRDTSSRRARSLVIDVLASAATPEAQRVMIELLAPADLRTLPEYGAWIQRFAFVDAPVPEVAAFLLDVHDDALASGDDLLRGASLLPLGAVAGHMAAAEPLMAAAMHGVIRESLDDADVEVAALAGIGNEARPDAIDDVLARVDHADPLVRTQAAATLRAFDDERARETLLEMLADDDDAVAIAALGALTDHQLGVDGSARLAAIAHSGAHHPRLAGALVSALGRRLADDPSVRSSLATLAARSDDARLRARVDRLLAT